LDRPEHSDKDYRPANGSGFGRHSANPERKAFLDKVDAIMKGAVTGIGAAGPCTAQCADHFLAMRLASTYLLSLSLW